MPSVFTIPQHSECTDVVVFDGMQVEIKKFMLKTSNLNYASDYPVIISRIIT